MFSQQAAKKIDLLKVKMDMEDQPILVEYEPEIMAFLNKLDSQDNPNRYGTRAVLAQISDLFDDLLNESNNMK